MGPLNVRYAVFSRGRSSLMVPEYCLTPDTKHALAYEMKCRAVPERLFAECKLDRPSTTCKHLFAIHPKKREGYFLVDHPKRIVTREALKEMFAEANAEGLERPLHIYCACSMLTGEGIDILQVEV